MNLVKFLLLPMLLIAIVVQYNYMPRYQLVGEELIGDVAAAKSLEGWKTLRGDGEILNEAGIVTFANGNSQSSSLILFSFPVPTHGEAILVQAEILVNNVRGGNRPYEKGRVYLVGRQADGNLMWQNRHIVTQLTGTVDWEEYDRAVPFNQDMTEMVLGIGLQNATGVMQVKNISLQAVNELLSFRILSALMLFFLVGVLVWHAVRVYRFKGRRLAGPGTWVLGALILVGVFLPGAIKRQLLGYFSDLWIFINSQIGTAGTATAPFGIELIANAPFSLEKLGHFVFFILITLYARRDFPTLRNRVLAVHLLVFAATTETLQFFTFERLPSFMDIAIDSSGILVGFAIIFVGAANRQRASKQ